MYKPNIENEMIDGFFEALSLVDTREEYYRFFEDICTVGEINAIAQRLEVAKMLADEQTYTRIAEVTGASTATISRVKKCLNYGSDGYKLVLERLKEKKDDSES
ncbi:MAG: YerC/YecD family TrpR-related protein [Peptococcaceae bacterium]|jgi:TrpR-related protein YerC/YecD|nr:YerC/YecD family TrpR-related protein [Peptococcaceae bacterium]MEE0229914.1 YerC/YecD family TrpR-related protein [Peptococcaceae bacterium]